MPARGGSAPGYVLPHHRDNCVTISLSTTWTMVLRQRISPLERGAEYGDPAQDRVLCIHFAERARRFVHDVRQDQRDDVGCGFALQAQGLARGHQVIEAQVAEAFRSQDGPGQRGGQWPIVPSVGFRLVADRAQQVVVRCEIHALRIDQEAEVFQVRIAVARQHVEDQPQVQAEAGRELAAAASGDRGERLDTALPVFETAVQVEQLAGVDRMRGNGVRLTYRSTTATCSAGEPLNARKKDASMAAVLARRR